MNRASLDRPDRSISPWVWLAALAALVALHFAFPDMEPPGFTDSFSATGEGKKAFFRLVDAQTGRGVRTFTPLPQHVSSLGWWGAEDTICLIGPARRPSSREIESLLDWVSQGGTLLWAVPEYVFSEGIWRDASLAGDAAAADEIELLPGVRLVPLPDSTTGPPETRFDTEGRFLWRTEAKLEADDGDTLVVQDGTEQAVRVEHGAGTILVLASDFVFSNQSLAWGDNSVLAYRLLDELDYGGEIHFDESLNATGAPKVVGLLLDVPLRGVTLQLLVLLVVFGWLGSRRFGPLLPESATARQNIVDHTDAVGALRFRSGDGSGALQSYLRQLAGALGLRLDAPRAKNGGDPYDRRLEPIARKMQVETETLRRLIRNAEQAAEQPRTDRRTAAALIRRLAAVRSAGMPDRGA